MSSTPSSGLPAGGGAVSHALRRSPVSASVPRRVAAIRSAACSSRSCRRCACTMRSCSSSLNPNHPTADTDTRLSRTRISRRLFGGLSHSRSGTMISTIVTAGSPEGVPDVSRFGHDAPAASARRFPCDTLTPMRWIFLLAISAASLFAQLAAPNDSGVSLGHIHLMVADPEVAEEALGRRPRRRSDPRRNA